MLLAEEDCEAGVRRGRNGSSHAGPRSQEDERKRDQADRWINRPHSTREETRRGEKGGGEGARAEAQARSGSTTTITTKTPPGRREAQSPDRSDAFGLRGAQRAGMQHNGARQVSGRSCQTSFYAS